MVSIVRLYVFCLILWQQLASIMKILLNCGSNNPFDPIQNGQSRSIGHKNEWHTSGDFALPRVLVFRCLAGLNLPLTFSVQWIGENGSGTFFSKCYRKECHCASPFSWYFSILGVVSRRIADSPRLFGRTLPTFQCPWNFVIHYFLKQEEVGWYRCVHFRSEGGAQMRCYFKSTGLGCCLSKNRGRATPHRTGKVSGATKNEI